MCVGFILLVHGTAFNLFLHKLCETWSPKLRGNKLASFEIAWMAGSLVVMTLGEDRATEGILWGNVDMPFICEDMVVILPVQEVGLEGSGDVLQR